MQGYKSFAEQIESITKAYSGLKIHTSNGQKFLKGTFEIRDDEGKVWDSYEIEIHCSPEFPKRFPILYEVGNKIPKIADWHINVHDPGEKKSCCITVLPDELFQCRNNISVLNFMKKQVSPYLFNQTHRRINGYYANDEFDHGTAGKWQFYAEKFGIEDKAQIISILKTYGGQLHKKSPCFCGRKAKFRKCHPEVYQFIKSVPLKYLVEEIRELTVSMGNS